MRELTINSLKSGGIITNYYCTSKCRHCLYACSPQWDKIYMDESQAHTLLDKIRSCGCSRIHLGGGEPFLNLPAIKTILQASQEQHVAIEYIETNSSWFRDRESAIQLLKEIRRLGVSTLLVSISPFHNEYIPFFKVKGVMSSARQAGFSLFPWMDSFYSICDSFTDTVATPFSEYQTHYGKDYIHTIYNNYWIHPGGRAHETFKSVYGLHRLENILREKGGCNTLKDTSHFHFDLFGNYIPGLCSGLSINYQHIGRPLPSATYPLITTLYNRGIKGLFDLAVQDYGFTPEDHYFSKCHLCHQVRQFLVLEKKVESLELQPIRFYQETAQYTFALDG